MIQELLFGGSSTTISSAYSGGGERNKAQINNNNNNGGIIVEATATAASKNPCDKANGNNTEQNLRCPRCDSSNTKFCYYNNYNLTQPRHFCKTCRRYWTKGGALRNVPIGGGCRKNKTSLTGKPKVYSSSADILLKSGLLDSQESSLHHPMMWLSSPQPQTTHLLAFLRSTQNLNPSNHTYLISSSPLRNSNKNPTGFTALNLLHGQTTSLSGFDYPCSNFFGNENQALNPTQSQLLQVPPQQSEAAQQLGGVQQNSGIQVLYQRIDLSTKSKTNSNSSGGDDTIHGHVGLENGVSPTCSRPGFESAQATVVGEGSHSGVWNGTAELCSSWTNNHLPGATNGDGFPL